MKNKEQEVEVQELKEVTRKNPSEYGYIGDEKITISARDFRILMVAAEQAIENTVTTNYPEVVKYIDPKTSKEVNPEDVTEEQLYNREVIEVTDRLRTFSISNTKRYFSDKLTPEIVEAQRILTEIHFENVDSGLAKHVTELKNGNAGE